MWRDSEVTCSRNSLLPDDITEDFGEEELVDWVTGNHLSEEANSRGLYQEPLLCTHHLNKMASSQVTPQTSVSMLELSRQQQQSLPFNTHMTKNNYFLRRNSSKLSHLTHTWQWTTISSGSSEPLLAHVPSNVSTCTVCCQTCQKQSNHDHKLKSQNWSLNTNFKPIIF